MARPAPPLPLVLTTLALCGIGCGGAAAGTASQLQSSRHRSPDAGAAPDAGLDAGSAQADGGTSSDGGAPTSDGGAGDAGSSGASDGGASGCSPQTTWRPTAGFAPLPDSEAHLAVCAAAESRPLNASANAYLPSPAELSTFLAAKDTYGQTPAQANPYLASVTGGCGGTGMTTDQIIQCTAAKWGIPADWLRAQYVQESYWHHIDPSTNNPFMGDKAYVGSAEALLYPAFSRELDSSGNPTGYVWQSLGLTQVKWISDGSVGAGTEPLRWKSSAFNADYQAATVRFYFDNPQGLRTAWGDSSYVAGEDWESIGGWFEPYPWLNAGQQSYISDVQGQLANRTWAQPGF